MGTQSTPHSAKVTVAALVIVNPYLHPPFGLVAPPINLCAVLTKLQPFKSSSDRSETLNPNVNAHAYEQVRQQYAREGMSQLKGKGGDGREMRNSHEEIHAYQQVRQQYAHEEMSRRKGKGEDGSEKRNPNEDVHAYEQARQQYAREEMSRLKGKGKETLPIGSTSSRSEPPVYRLTTSFSPPSTSTSFSPTSTTTSFSPPYITKPFFPSSTTKPFSPPSTTTHNDSAQARALQAQLESERASYDLARQLQAQEDATVREHQQLVQEAARVKLFECVVCMEEYPEGYSAPIRSCGHALCRTCMREHVQSQVDQAAWPVRCPTCVADASRTEQQGGEHRPASLEPRC